MLKFDTPPSYEEEKFLSEEENYAPERLVNCLKYLRLLLYARRQLPISVILDQEDIYDKYLTDTANRIETDSGWLLSKLDNNA